MSDAAAPRMPYRRARLLLLLAGLVVMLILMVFIYVRQVEGTERYGAVLFVPVFVAFVFWNIPGGAIAGVLAGAVYVALRWKELDIFGTQDFIELVLARTIFYVAFGVIGGWANKQMEGSLTKLELYDQIDDSTGLFNARFFMQDTDLEMSRAGRYQTLFSVAAVDIPAPPIAQLSKRQRAMLLKDMGRILTESVRTVDRAVHGSDARFHKIAVVLPETGREGVRIFSGRLADRLGEYLISKGVPLTKEQIISKALTYPDDESELEALRAEFAGIERSEHPEEGG